MAGKTLHRPFELLEIEGLLNVRGFGGFPISAMPGFVTQNNRIIRSAHLENLTDRGRKGLQALKVAKIFDLRHAGESDDSMQFLRQNPPVSPDASLDARRVRVHLESGRFSASKKLAFYKSRRENHTKVMGAEYFRVLTSEEGTIALKSVLLALLQNPMDRILIHCTLGKDRTGVVFALLLSLVGVSDHDVGKDYESSQQELRSLEEPIRSYIQSIEPSIEEKEATSIALEVLRAEAGSILETFHLIRESFGGIEQLICSKCELQVKDIDALKSSLIQKYNV